MNALSALSNSTLDELRIIVLGAFICATMGVILGVGFENEAFNKRTRHVGWLLLLFSLGSETWLTIELFAVDSTIIHRQESTIEQLLRPRRLTAEQKDRIARAIKPFPSIIFRTVAVPEAEPWDFVMDIGAALKADGWNWVSCVNPDGTGLQPLAPDPRPSSCTSILAHIQINAPPILGAAAKALGDAIKEPVSIGMEDVRVVITDKVTNMTIIVGSKR